MKMLFQGYDLTLAVTARHLLLRELTKSNDEVSLKVWEPTKLFFEEMQSTRLKSLVFFIGETYQFPPNMHGKMAHLYAVNSQKEVCYVGTIFNRVALDEDRKYQLEHVRTTRPQELKLLRKKKIDTIVRDTCFCIIPSPAQNLKKKELEDAVKKYLEVFHKELEHLTIRWLPFKLGKSLEAEINRQADLLPIKKLSQKERLRAFVENEIW